MSWATSTATWSVTTLCPLGGMRIGRGAPLWVHIAYGEETMEVEPDMHDMAADDAEDSKDDAEDGHSGRLDFGRDVEYSSHAGQESVQAPRDFWSLC